MASYIDNSNYQTYPDAILHGHRGDVEADNTRSWQHPRDNSIQSRKIDLMNVCPALRVSVPLGSSQDIEQPDWVPPYKATSFIKEKAGGTSYESYHAIKSNGLSTPKKYSYQVDGESNEKQIPFWENETFHLTHSDYANNPKAIINKLLSFMVLEVPWTVTFSTNASSGNIIHLPHSSATLGNSSGGGKKNQEEQRNSEQAEAKAKAIIKKKGYWICCACSPRGWQNTPWVATLNIDAKSECWKCKHTHCKNCPDPGNWESCYLIEALFRRCEK